MTTKVLICKDDKDAEGGWAFMDVEPVDAKEHLEHGWARAADTAEAMGVVAARAKEQEEAKAGTGDTTVRKPKTVVKGGGDTAIKGEASIAGAE